MESILSTSTLRLAAAVLVGMAASLPLVHYGQRLSPRARCRFWALNLAIAALIYVAAALFVEPAWVGLQLWGLVGYSVLAVLGVRWSPRLIAVGWALHVAWDFLGHPVTLDPHAANASFMPWWYPPACLGFDLFVAGVLWFGLSEESS